MKRALTRTVKSVAERAFGVSITRAQRFPPNQHADHVLRGMRTWSPEDVFFDVGANDGRTILRLEEQLGRPRIFAFEPVSGTYRTLVDRTAHLPHVRTFPFALGSERARREIYLHTVDAVNSFSPLWTDAWHGVEQVQVRTLDDVLEELGIETVHFLKVDTEGHEMEVLKGAEQALQAARIEILQIEVGVDQLPKPMVSLETARQHLAARGYVLKGIYNQCTRPAQPPATWPEAERAGFHAEALAYCDALFVRAT
ncbi:MAG: FkbM family methyltransferase [Vicinamibacterales bacterium]